MLQQLTTSIRRRAIGALSRGQHDGALAIAPPDYPVLAAQAEMGMLRGVTPAAADVTECVCPEPCERDHANE